ncbi:MULTISPECIES: cyclic nucleotide-binding domain-containing protein [unclassified Janthinobacterium]|uniref:cyclic nucleotide-binding domain-containing protein n=1 Tax=unclassified Janthinobacterium TaxID=2610881 RepID=UPI00179F3981|nr:MULTISPECIES: cyclic nucleotide-binding domain-containing protein [unclassified Janthinobacterium]MBB5608831.1 signal-transduction protein with cAMP-binding, CBS, and nucleotidyltransferase domain [Janthinobacterium sp. S3T4]MBB5615903.1 signal-transduction protein with cAMP-binding, CBS, and nucleotidyltransferase domain [Janthinobacterium sp. S3M3]
MSHRLSPFILAAGALLMPLAQVAHSFNAGHQDASMQASTTYLYLLRKTPFFTRLTTAQLREVINHSKEWEVKPGTAIAASGDAARSVWILLDGEWQVEAGGKVYPALHDQPGKWYGRDAVYAAAQPSRLVVNQHSYVMQIRQADFESMLAQGYDFQLHLSQGEQYYGRLLQAR